MYAFFFSYFIQFGFKKDMNKYSGNLLFRHFVYYIYNYTNKGYRYFRFETTNAMKMKLQ